MARKSGSESSVSLFPFLAVLVCVMGSLIFLLLATTKRMHDIAAAEVRAKLEASDAAASPQSQLGTPQELSLPQPSLDPEELHRRREMEQSLERQIADLQSRRDQLQQAVERQELLGRKSAQQTASLEQDVQQGQTKLRGLLAQIESTPDEAALTENLADLEAQITELRRKLRQLQNRRTEGNSKFTVVPFDVRSGTTRRPILIECTERGLRFLPEDVIIKPHDLEGFTERYNPLLTGARTLIGYWNEHDRESVSAEPDGEPYVLLIVRPNGIVAYYVAMKMLSTLKQPFGYELVDDTISLQPPALDETAQAQCRMAVEQQLAERNIVAGSGRGGGGGSGNGSGGSGRGNGRGVGKGGAAAGGRGAPKETFEVSDILPQEENVGERSWEKFDRFEGRKNRGGASSPSGGFAGHGAAGGAEPGSGVPREGVPGGGVPGGAASRKPPESLAAGEGGAAGGETSGEGWSPPTDGKSSPGSGNAAEGSEEMNGEPPEEFPVYPDDPPPQPARASSPPRNARSLGSGGSSDDDPGLPNQRPNQRPPRGPQPRRPPGAKPSGNPHDEEYRIAQLARRHWGQSEAGATIGIEQDVSIRVDAEQMIVAGKHRIAYQPGEPSKELYLRLLEAVDIEAQHWGKPKRGFYWTPRLRFSVSPEGKQAFERIDPWVVKSGISMTKTFMLNSAQSSQPEVVR